MLAERKLMGSLIQRLETVEVIEFMKEREKKKKQLSHSHKTWQVLQRGLSPHIYLQSIKGPSPVYNYTSFL